MTRQPRGVGCDVDVRGGLELFLAQSGLLGEGRGVCPPFVGAAGTCGYSGDDDLAVDGGKKSVAQQAGPQGEHA